MTAGWLLNSRRSRFARNPYSLFEAATPRWWAIYGVTGKYSGGPSTPPSASGKPTFREQRVPFHLKRLLRTRKLPSQRGSFKGRIDCEPTQDPQSRRRSCTRQQSQSLSPSSPCGNREQPSATKQATRRVGATMPMQRTRAQRHYVQGNERQANRILPRPGCRATMHRNTRQGETDDLTITPLRN